jgi:hypothetical protein
MPPDGDVDRAVRAVLADMMEGERAAWLSP